MDIGTFVNQTFQTISPLVDQIKLFGNNFYDSVNLLIQSAGISESLKQEKGLYFGAFYIFYLLCGIKKENLHDKEIKDAAVLAQYLTEKGAEDTETEK
jgi:hypothetical protein